MLYYFHDSFIQLIEGDEEKVKTLYQKIAEDGRHQFVTIIKEGTIEQRFFPNWMMGYKTLTAAELKDMPQPVGQSGLVDSTAIMHLLDISAN